MQFWQYRTTRSCWKLISPSQVNSVSVAEFYAKNIAYSFKALKDNASSRQQMLEGWWEIDRYPYYRVYPSIIPMLVRLNLAIDTELIRLPMRVFAVYFPKIEHKLSFDVDGKRFYVHSLLCGPASLVKRETHEIYDGISIWVDFGETFGTCGVTEKVARDFPLLTYINLPTKKGLSVEAASMLLYDDPSATMGVRISTITKATILKLVCTLCLLENDPAVIEPDVLDKDRSNYESQPNQAIVDRAVRRGKIGWNVGRKIELIPHVRGPSPFALYWTGKGRTVPLVRYRKGCIVHKEVVTRVPTGFGRQNEQETEAEV